MQNAVKTMELELATALKDMKAIHLTNRKAVDENVNRMKIVLTILLVFETNASILVLELAALMLFAKLPNTFLYADVQTVILVIHSSLVNKFQLRLHHVSIPANLHLVARILNAEKLTPKQSVLVCQIILEVPLVVVLNALLIQSARHKWLV
jgi:hypothetical protein